MSAKFRAIPVDESTEMRSQFWYSFAWRQHSDVYYHIHDRYGMGQPLTINKRAQCFLLLNENGSFICRTNAHFHSSAFSYRQKCSERMRIAADKYMCTPKRRTIQWKVFSYSIKSAKPNFVEPVTNNTSASTVFVFRVSMSVHFFWQNIQSLIIINNTSPATWNRWRYLNMSFNENSAGYEITIFCQRIVQYKRFAVGENVPLLRSPFNAFEMSKYIFQTCTHTSTRRQRAKWRRRHYQSTFITRQQIRSRNEKEKRTRNIVCIYRWCVAKKALTCRQVLIAKLSLEYTRFVWWNTL